MTTTHDQLLITALDTAVSIQMAVLAGLPADLRAGVVKAWAEEALDLLPYGADVLRAGYQQPGETAKAVNALAKALAAGAQIPGGITFAGQHWQAAEQLPAGTP